MSIDFRFEPTEEAKFVAHMKAEQRPSALICTCTALVVWIAFICLDFIRVDWLQELSHGHVDAAVMIAMRMVTLGVLLTTAWALFFLPDLPRGRNLGTVCQRYRQSLQVAWRPSHYHG
jgi:uncharacterized membrane protein (DUF485 family)